jgi:hypothetical protein
MIFVEVLRPGTNEVPPQRGHVGPSSLGTPNIGIALFVAIGWTAVVGAEARCHVRYEDPVLSLGSGQQLGQDLAFTLMGEPQPGHCVVESCDSVSPSRTNGVGSPASNHLSSC